MKRKRICFFVLLPFVIYLFLFGHETDLSQYYVKQVIEMFSTGSLNNKSLIKLLGENLKIYYYDPNWIGWNINEDSGSLFVEKDKNLIGLIFKDGKKARNLGHPPTSVIFKNNNGFPISMLVEIFGKWTYYSNEKRMLTKYPMFHFERRIDDKLKVHAIASAIYGPNDKPIQCVCLSFSLSIEKR